MAANPDNSTTMIATGAPFTPELQMANMLGLCEAQMESALQESDHAVDSLVKAFTSLVEASRSMNELTQNLPTEVKQTIAPNLDLQVESISKEVASAVMAFQFYDKLTQRLGHVRYSLSTLALFVCDRTQSTQPDQWRRLQNTMRRLYRTEEERQIFHMIFNEAAGSDATLERPALSDSKAGEVELF